MVEITDFRVDGQVTVKILQSQQPFRVAVRHGNGLIHIFSSKYSWWDDHHWASIKLHPDMSVLGVKIAVSVDTSTFYPATGLVSPETIQK